LPLSPSCGHVTKNTKIFFSGPEQSENSKSFDTSQGGPFRFALGEIWSQTFIKKTRKRNAFLHLLSSKIKTLCSDAFFI